MYRTGDRARLLPNGAIEFLGRIDRQVKLRGFRIELEEIERVARMCPGITDCVTVLREDNPVHKELVAYVVHETKGTSIEPLKRFLAQKLPVFMLPSALVSLDSLPLNSNGKVDRERLPAPNRSGSDPSSGAEAPRNAIEASLAWIWERTLLVEHISVTDNFFDLGGHSLLATDLVARVVSVFKMEVPLKWLFEKPTVGAFAEILAAHEPRPGHVERVSMLFMRARNKSSAANGERSRTQYAQQGPG